MTVASTPADEAVRDGLVRAILAFLGTRDLLTVDEIRPALEREVDDAGTGALMALRERLGADHGWTYYPPDPLARRIHHLLADRFLEPESMVDGVAHLASIGNGPVVIFANHLSYADANVIEVLLHRAGASAIADRLTAIAGPKVFTDRQRRFSSLCFGTIKVPQSTGVASDEAVLSAREVAKAARRSLDAARARLDAGDALLLFAEGTRSRTGEMRPMLPAVARYLAGPGLRVLPIGLTGSEELLPIDDPMLRPARGRMSVGAPIEAAALTRAAGGDRHVVMDAIGLAVADQLPEAYRGAYRDPAAWPGASEALEVCRRDESRRYGTPTTRW
jgi:1-acyl-sn-glycerol-3-phosphate acyltransferase